MCLCCSRCFAAMFCVPPHGAHQAVSAYCTAITFSAPCAGACSLSATGDDSGLLAPSLVEASKALQGVLCQNEWSSSDFSTACAWTASEGDVCAVGRAAPSACWATPRLWQQTKHAWMTRSTLRGQARAQACDQLVATLLLLTRKEAASAALKRCKRVLALDQRGAEALRCAAGASNCWASRSKRWTSRGSSKAPPQQLPQEARKVWYACIHCCSSCSTSSSRLLKTQLAAIRSNHTIDTTPTELEIEPHDGVDKWQATCSQSSALRLTRAATRPRVRL